MGDPFEHEVLCPGDRMTGSFVPDHVFNLRKKEFSAKEISVLEKYASKHPGVRSQQSSRPLPMNFAKKHPS